MPSHNSHPVVRVNLWPVSFACENVNAHALSSSPIVRLFARVHVYVEVIAFHLAARVHRDEGPPFRQRRNLKESAEPEDRAIDRNGMTGRRPRLRLRLTGRSAPRRVCRDREIDHGDDFEPAHLIASGERHTLL